MYVWSSFSSPPKRNYRHEICKRLWKWPKPVKRYAHNAPTSMQQKLGTPLLFVFFTYYSQSTIHIHHVKLKIKTKQLRSSSIVEYEDWVLSFSLVLCKITVMGIKFLRYIIDEEVLVSNFNIRSSLCAIVAAKKKRESKWTFIAAPGIHKTSIVLVLRWH